MSNAPQDPGTNAERPTGFERVLTDPPPPWFVELYPGGHGEGFLHKLKRHAVAFHDRSDDVLLVTFDNLAVVNDLSFAREPWGWKFIRDQGWSHLGIFARNKAWYRDSEIIDYLADRRDDGLFAGYRTVVFAGSSMGAFAALAFAELAPGCRVLAFNPQTTLDHREVPWEGRYPFGRMQDWDLPFGDGARAGQFAERVFVVYDHFFEPDRRHAERIRGDGVVPLKCWFANHFAAPMLKKMGLLKPVMLGAVDGSLTAASYYESLRVRRNLPWYMRAMKERADATGHGRLMEAARSRFMELKSASAAREMADG